MKEKCEVTEHFDWVCVLLRKGDFDVLRVHVNEVSVWVRELVAKHCDKLIGKREEAPAAKIVWQMVVEDPNL